MFLFQKPSCNSISSCKATKLKHTINLLPDLQPIISKAPYFLDRKQLYLFEFDNVFVVQGPQNLGLLSYPFYLGQLEICFYNYLGGYKPRERSTFTALSFPFVLSLAAATTPKAPRPTCSKRENLWLKPTPMSLSERFKEESIWLRFKRVEWAVGLWF